MYGERIGRIMRKRFISICIVGILVFGVCGCTRTDEEILDAEAEIAEPKYTDAEDTETAMAVEEYGQSEEETVLPESADEHSETDMVSLLDMLREIKEYKMINMRQVLGSG